MSAAPIRIIKGLRPGYGDLGANPQGHMAAKTRAGIELGSQEENFIALALQSMTKLDLKAGHEAALERRGQITAGEPVAHLPLRATGVERQHRLDLVLEHKLAERNSA